MRKAKVLIGLLLFTTVLGFSRARITPQQKTPDASEPKITPEDIAKKNPVTPTPEGLAEARKFFGYNCAMCHGKGGDGKGDLVEEMKLTLLDWRDATSLEKMTDGELFWIITNGKGKMLGEGDRTPQKLRWNYVNLVRTFGKKGSGDKPKAENPKS